MQVFYFSPTVLKKGFRCLFTLARIRCTNQTLARNGEKLTSFSPLKPKGIPPGHLPPVRPPPCRVHQKVTRSAGQKGFISNHSLEGRVSLCPLLSAGPRCKSIPDQAALAAAAASAAAAAPFNRSTGGREQGSPLLNVKALGSAAQSMSPVAGL